MSCSQPIKIINKKYLFQKGIDKGIIDVPCGHCSSCNAARSDEWLVRLYSHWQDFNKNGKTFFLTLTYNNKHVPRYIAEDKISEKTGEICNYNFKCFSHDHIATYINSCARALKREYNICRFDYFVACEFGLKYTKRPHYHILLFVDNCRQFPENAIKRVFTRLWTKGFTKWPLASHGGAVIQNESGIKYVSKYVNKDMGWYDQPAIKHFLANFDKSELRGKLPTHWQSQGLGISLYSYLNNLDANDVCKYIHDGFRLKFDVKRSYKIPRYIKDKLKYEKPIDINGHHVRMLSPLGQYIEEFKFNDDVKTLASNYERDFSYLGLHRYFADNGSVEAFSKKYCRKTCTDFYQLSEYLKSELLGYNYTSLAQYSLAYRGYSFPHQLFGNFRSIESPYEFKIAPTPASLLKNAYYVHKYRNLESVIIPKQILSDEDKVKDSKESFAGLKVFENFDYLLSIVDKMKLHHSKGSGDLTIHQINKVRKIKEFYDLT